jgi:predicted ABC-type ATPase
MAKMVLVAGPPGGGKSSVMGTRYFSNLKIPCFNIDERCKHLHGSSYKIPLQIRQQANEELRIFCQDRIRSEQTFAFETTLRADFAIRTARGDRVSAIETEIHHRETQGPPARRVEL